jgi:GT2 family glycosyltransferase
MQMNGLRRNDDAINYKAGNQTLPSVAIVILNWNGKDYLQKFLPSVLSSTYENKRIIVADNASTDDSFEFLKANFSAIEIIKNTTNEGFAKGYNTALKNIEADYFVLLNSDVEVESNWIEPIITLMQSDKQIAACQPKILSYANKTQFEYAGASGGFIDYLGYPFSRGRIFDDCEKDEGQYNDAMPCFWATGAALFVKASVYKQLNGLDEYFFAHQEEIDFCWRLQLSGYKIYVQPKSVVYHVGGGTLNKENPHKIYLNFRNNLIMLYKNLPFFKKIYALAAYKNLFKGDAPYYFAIAKAHFHFIGWLFWHKKKSFFVKDKNSNVVGVINKSIVWRYFFKKQKTFKEIIS